MRFCGWKFIPSFDAYDTCMTVFCVSPAWRANDASLRWWQIPNRRQTFSPFFHRTLVCSLEFKTTRRNWHKRNPFWFIVVYTEITAGVEKRLSYVLRTLKAILIKSQSGWRSQGVGDTKMTVFVGSVVLWWIKNACRRLESTTINKVFKPGCFVENF